MASTHETIRGAVADALTTALAAQDPEVTVTVTEQDVPDVRQVDLPAVIVSYAGTEYPTGEYTSERDYYAFPILVGLYTLDPDRPSGDPAGCDLTTFREILRRTFHHRRLAGLSTVLWCTYDGQPQIAEDALEAFKALRTAAVVTAVASVARG